MDIDKIIKILENKKQIVLQGAPGTGKTYITAELAVRMCDGSVPGNRNDLMKRYRQLIREGRIAFTTFHQSMDYEQFVEGFVPQIKNDAMTYKIRKGIFKGICQNALPNYKKAFDLLIQRIKKGELNSLISATNVKYENLTVLKTSNGEEAIYFAKDGGDKFENDKKANDSKLIRWSRIQKAIDETESIEEAKNYLKNNRSGDSSKQIAVLNKVVEIWDTDVKKKYVLIIDEINRGNISKILGELITLLEADKRAGEDNCVSATLPYSNETFSVPSNLYIIGTMNTADRSVGYIDYAVRRRFAFITITSDRDIIKEHYEMLNSHDQNLGKDILNVYNKIENHIYTPGNISSDIKPEDIMVGHSYFLAKDRDDFSYKLQYEILPLLAEYHGDGLLNAKLDKETIKDIWPLK